MIQLKSFIEVTRGAVSKGAIIFCTTSALPQRRDAPR